jgi:hypothetical protein
VNKSCLPDYGNEMVQAMTKHVMEKHPDKAKAIEKMQNEDPKKWGRETKPKWEATPENIPLAKPHILVTPGG